MKKNYELKLTWLAEFGGAIEAGAELGYLRRSSTLLLETEVHDKTLRVLSICIARFLSASSLCF